MTTKIKAENIDLSADNLAIGGTSSDPFSEFAGTSATTFVINKQSNSHSAVIQLDAGNSAGAYLQLGTAGTKTLQLSSVIGADGYNNKLTSVHSGSNLVLGTNNTDRLTLEADGDLRVLTGGAKIYHDGSSGGVTRTTEIELYNSSDGGLNLKTNNAAGGGIKLHTQGTERLDIKGTGHINISDHSSVATNGLKVHLEVLNSKSYAGGTAWTNLVPGNNATFASTSYTPGKRQVEFNSSSATMTMTNPVPTETNCTVCMLVSTSSPQFLFLTDTDGSQNYLGANKSSNGLYHGGVGNSVTTKINQTTITNMHTEKMKHIRKWMYVTFEGVDFSQGDDVTTGSNDWNTLQINTYSGYQMYNHGSSIGAMLVYNRALTSQEHHQNMHYFQRMYGTHPDWSTDITAVPFNSPWTNYGSNWRNCYYWRDSEGWVHFSGLASASSSTTASFMDLPKGFRVLQREIFGTIGSGNVMVRMDSTGDDIFANNSHTGWLSLNDLTWLANGE